jgi:hypothetical protein
MSAEKMFKSLNRKAPAEGKEKHHGNIRHCLTRMKHLMRKADRAKAKQEMLKDEE